MILTIDTGNTTTKVVLFDDTIPVYRNVEKQFDIKHIKKICRNYPVRCIIQSSVVSMHKTNLAAMKKLALFIGLNSRTRVPVKNLYRTPKTLGSDRLANAVGGAFLMPQRNVLIIDMGTCIKYDFVNSKGAYVGGSISPGLTMRFRALHDFTGKLPLLREAKVDKLEGQTTVESIQTGVVRGIAAEINGFISLYRKKHKSLKVIITGGDAFHFAQELNLSIFAAADLVNIGLNQIARYNIKKK